MLLVSRAGLISLGLRVNCTRDLPLAWSGGGAMVAAMAIRPGFILAIVICAVVIAWWALSGFPMISLVCREAHQMTLFRGPFSSLCYRSFLSDAPAESRESI
jgi:hypothetical protein